MFPRYRPDGNLGQIPGWVATLHKVDLSYPASTEDLRADVRQWLIDHLPHGWFDEGFEMSESERSAFLKAWVQELFRGGWICANWPKEYGGKGLNLIEQVVVSEEFARAGAPLRADFFGDTLVGPTLLEWGTEAQKTEFLPGILQGSTSWCQGFSEPNAGSDLAALRCQAVLDGDEWIINGQKVWTTQAQFADYMFLLARTDNHAAQHAGISFILVPMHQTGIEVRPITQIDGSSEFNEVFFTDARAPKDNVVGGVNNGWKVAMTTLGFERGASSTTGFRRFLSEWEEIVAVAKHRGATTDPIIRQGLVRSWTDIKIMEINGYRILTDAINGTNHSERLNACNKMFWSESHRRTMELYIDLLGPEGQILTGSGLNESSISGHLQGTESYPVSKLQASFLFSRSETIWGGAAEIQRNIVAERALGLPKEPKTKQN
jgi:alkylation response protein AidB-like acyl-CoA dehydrogenase